MSKKSLFPDEPVRINLGSGFDPQLGYVNVDWRQGVNADVMHDLNETPWPFEDGSAEEIRAFDVFEHLADVVAAMDECWRILKPGGVLWIRGPAWNSPNVSDDVTHRRGFTLHSFDHFDWSTGYGAQYRYGCGEWRIVDKSDAVNELYFKLEKVTADVGNSRIEGGFGE